MRCLLDSHTLLWTLYEPWRLPAEVRRILESDESELFVNHISPWERADKAAKMKLPMVGASVDRFMATVSSLQATMVAIELEDIVASVKLPRHS